MRDTPVFSAKIWNGRRTLRFMSVGGMFDLRLRFRLRLGLIGVLRVGLGRAWLWFGWAVGCGSFSFASPIVPIM